VSVRRKEERVTTAANTPFKTLFGANEHEIKKYCILLPCNVPAVLNTWKPGPWSRGLLYQVTQTKYFTVIHTRMGAGLVGDAVLYLKQTPCEALFLLGSCGLVQSTGRVPLALGSLVIPGSCYALESFSEFLLRKNLLADTAGLRCFKPHKHLLENFLEKTSATNISQVRCATVSSLKLEEENLPLLQQAGIETVDMECSAFLAAAQATDLPALALFWISDSVKQQPFYHPLTTEEKDLLAAGAVKSAGLLAGYCAGQSI
jgi:purine-nucleoside phosphorylase